MPSPPCLTGHGEPPEVTRGQVAAGLGPGRLPTQQPPGAERRPVVADRQHMHRVGVTRVVLDVLRDGASSKKIR
jgi:hypothetical protein